MSSEFEYLKKKTVMVNGYYEIIENQIPFESTFENEMKEKLDADNFYLNHYYFSVPGDLFEEIEEKAGEVHNENVKKNLNDLMYFLQKNLKNTNRYIENPLLPLAMDINEDESVFLEWIFNDFRIGFNVSEKPDKSTWFLVTNGTAFDNIQTRKGSFSKYGMDRTVNQLVRFALENC